MLVHVNRICKGLIYVGHLYRADIVDGHLRQSISHFTAVHVLMSPLVRVQTSLELGHRSGGVNVRITCLIFMIDYKPPVEHEASTIDNFSNKIWKDQCLSKSKHHTKL